MNHFSIDYRPIPRIHSKMRLVMGLQEVSGSLDPTLTPTKFRSFLVLLMGFQTVTDQLTDRQAQNEDSTTFFQKNVLKIMNVG